ncbi:hypothetical protein [Granulicella sp. dw_53]|uniref:hypothetical protein n=1 Tax=Granulicella sp. dw_53 TaxID=2719792 RepID=UPI001BD20244|nr:hypothetical protein [Granulicella sp. dw_53]
MRRKLSALEQILDGNVVYFVRLEGHLGLDQLRSALTRVQHKHPALRSLLRKERNRLYYEADSAPEIPLRIVARVSEDGYRHECQTELTTVFAHELPQLRVVWLQSELESDLLFTTSHRICDGMSIFILVREILRSLYSDEEMVPYEPITMQEIIGDYKPPQPWKNKLKVSLLNGVLRLIPNSRRAPENNERYLEWKTDGALLDVLRKRCKEEVVSMHAALMCTLERALFVVFERNKVPKWIDNPMDIRRGRFPALKSDTVFFAGGSFKTRIEQTADIEFWGRARTIYAEIQRQVEQETLKIPGRFRFWEMLHPLASGQIQSIVRLGDALKFNGSWNMFALSNLGNIVINDSSSPFRVKDLRIYMHSFTFRALCLVTYTLNGEMRFYCVADEKCLSHSQADTLQREFMAILKQAIKTDESETEVSSLLTAVAK